MVNLHPTTWYLLLEALVLLGAGTGLLIFFSLRRQYRRKSVLLGLVERLKSGGADRNAALQAILAQNASLHADQLSGISQQVLTAETHFYQFLVKALLDPDQRDLARLDDHVEALTDAINRAVPHTGATASPGMNTDVGGPALTEIKEALALLQKSQGQLAGDLKASVESLRSAIAALGTAGVAAAAAPAAAATAKPATEPSLDLESLPDIEETFTAPPQTTTPEPASAARETTEPSADLGDQIAEMPDDLLGDTPAQPAPAAAIQIEEEITASTSDDTGAASADTPLDAAATLNDALIDDLIANTADQTKASLVDAGDVSTQTEAPAEPPDAVAQPLIPEVETDSADKKAEETQGKPQSTTSVDDLLLELDELLK